MYPSLRLHRLDNALLCKRGGTVFYSSCWGRGDRSQKSHGPYTAPVNKRKQKKELWPLDSHRVMERPPPTCLHQEGLHHRQCADQGRVWDSLPIEAQEATSVDRWSLRRKWFPSPSNPITLPLRAAKCRSLSSEMYMHTVSWLLRADRISLCLSCWQEFEFQPLSTEEKI